MLAMDIPNVPAQETPLMVAATTMAQTSVQKFDRVIGVCHLSENPFVPQSAVNVLEPADEAVMYLRQEEHSKITDQANTSVLNMPEHGVLENEGKGYFAYYPKKGYIGGDRATLLVDVGGKKIKMEYFFRVMRSIPQGDDVAPSPYKTSGCPKEEAVWKISTAVDTR
jgi:hypothetical protein